MPARSSSAPPVSSPVVLIGPMAVGKSAIGQHLAHRLGHGFVDTDAAIVAQHGTITAIFACRGEHAFREIEARAVAAAIEPLVASQVISLGGGAVLDSGTQQLLEKCVVVYLEADESTVRERIARSSNRPLLAGDAVSRWNEMFAMRRPVYERLADVVLDVREGTAAHLAAHLEDVLRGNAAAQKEVEE